MKLSTLTVVGATSVVATAAAVWVLVDPSQESRAAASAPRATAPDRSDPQAPVTPVVDRSHFTAGKTLMVEGRLGHPVLPAGTDSETFLYIDVSADAGRTAAMVPLELAIVVDRSGSMRGKKIANAFAATRKAIERLRDGDIVSVVAYDTRAEVVLAPTRIDAATRARVLRELARPRVGGDTCISCGIETGMRQLGQRPGMVRRVLLLSDGLATAGVRDLAGFRRIAEDSRRLGTAITTIGVDVDYDERVMAALARDSNGGHHFVANADALPAIFDREMASLTRTVADRAELVVDLAPGVFADHVFDRVTVATGSQVVIPFGAFASGEHKTALLRLRVPRGQAGERPIAAVRLRYDDLVDQRPGSCEGQLAVVASADPSKVAPLDGLVSARVSSSETAETLTQANELVRSGRGDDARRLLRDKADRLEEQLRGARKSAPAGRGADLDAAFSRQRAALTGAGKALEPASAGAPAPAPTAPAVKAQVRENQADAFQLSN